MFKLVLLFSAHKNCTFCFCEEHCQPGATALPLRALASAGNLWSSCPTLRDPELISQSAVVLVFALTESWLHFMFVCSQ